MFFSSFLSNVKIYNKFLHLMEFNKNYKYVLGFKDFFFQLIYENADFFLIFMFLYLKKIKPLNLKIDCAGEIFDISHSLLKLAWTTKDQ